MARLSQHLQYFVNKKISEDAEWRGVEVILSGHDVRCPILLTERRLAVGSPPAYSPWQVPGEGEHKIQEYIRLSKAQTD